MSIPKQPRQLMINIMYLVLTAMLALNVSAEVMNAFFDIDKSLTKSSAIADKNHEETKKGLQGLLDKKPKIKEPINNGLDVTKAKVDAFVNQIEDLKDRLIDAAGDANGVKDEGDFDKKGKPRGKKNKDITTRMLVLGANDDNSGEAHALEGDIKTLREELIKAYGDVLRDKEVSEVQGFNLKPELIDDRLASLENSMTLNVSDDWKEHSDKDSWAAYKFFQMPLAATLPILSKLQTDARNAQANISGKIAELVGGKEIKFDKFFPVLNAKKGYVIKGEKFDADVSLGAYSSEVKDVSITINGQRINLGADGVGKFSETANQYGKRVLNLSATVKNPLTGKTDTGKATFEYEVGERSATVSATKMNVFYIGVDNPVEVAVAGASSNEIKVSCSGGGCNMTGSGGKYNVKVQSQGTAKITVSAKTFSKTFDYRVKRIPNPVAKFGGKTGGSMGDGSFKAQKGLIADLENFDFDAKCRIQGFKLVHVPKRQDAKVSVNSGASFGQQARSSMNKAKPGDVFYFDDVKARCPGDKAARTINSLVFKIG